MKFWVTQDRLVVDTATVELRGGLQDATEGTVTASTGSLSYTTSPEADGSWRVSVPLEIGVNEITVTATDGAGLTSTWTGTVVRLITDRVQADLDALNALLRRLAAGTETEADWAAFNSPTQRGAYNDTDLNRVIAAANLVYQSLVGQGLVVDYKPIDIERPQTGRLPDGYTELEYIESTGTQYIDIGFKPDQDTRIICDVIFQVQSSAAWLFGSRTDNTVKTYGFLTYSGFYRSDYYESLSTIEVIPDGKFTIDKDGNTTYLNNEVVNTSPYGEFQGEYNLYLFANNNHGSVQGYCVATVFKCNIYDAAILIRNYIPCKTPSGEVGLYDTVGQQFYGNAGTGVFTAGPEVPAPPPVVGDSWAEGDIPTQNQLQTYLQNVANLLQARLVQAQYITLPASMANLTLAGANNIEWALVCVDAVTPVVRKSYIYSGEAMAGEF